MQEHMDILMVLAGLGVALLVFFAVKIFSKQLNQGSTIAENHSVDPQIGNLDELCQQESFTVRKVSTEPESETPSVIDPNQQDVVYALHVMAKDNQHFQGYELLQALLSQGLRFGDMNIFHRYQQTNGKGAVLFSLTSAVEPGTFDIHNMGTYSCPGLTLFMQGCGRANVDIERFELMVQVAQNLARELGGLCQNRYRQALTEETIRPYRQQIFGELSSETSEPMSETA